MALAAPDAFACADSFGAKNAARRFFQKLLTQNRPIFNETKFFYYFILCRQTFLSTGNH
jgi:hypothetical protein